MSHSHNEQVDLASSSESLEQEQISEEQEFQSNENANLQSLQQKIAFNNAQLLQLTFNDQKFMNKIIEYNNCGIEAIRNQDFQRSLIYLQEAERILQYSASCGKTIDRFLIVYTLHNEASAYQKIWQLQKSADYMEAIIYNMNTYLKNCQTVEICSELSDSQSELSHHFSSYLHRRLLLAIYSLQYSAINSQIGKHQLAIESVKVSLNLLSKNLSELYAYESFMRKYVNKKSMVKLLRDQCLGMSKQRIPEMIKSIRKELKRLKSRIISPEEEFLMKLQKFSIGEVMQMQPKPFESIIQITPAQKMLMQQGIVSLAIYTSISYYAIATQMRLKNARNSIITPAEKTIEFEKSKIFHANSIMIALQFIPCVTDYLEHIVRSFKNNYQIDLNCDSSQLAENKSQNKEYEIYSQNGEIQNGQTQNGHISSIYTQNKNQNNRQVLSWEILTDQSFGIREDYSLVDSEQSEIEQENMANIVDNKCIKPPQFKGHHEIDDFGFHNQFKTERKRKKTKSERKLSVTKKSEKSSNLQSNKKAKIKQISINPSKNYSHEKGTHKHKKQKYNYLKTSQTLLKKNISPETRRAIIQVKPFSKQDEKNLEKTSRLKITDKKLRNLMSREKERKQSNSNYECHSNNCNSTEKTKDQTKKLTDIDKKEKKRKKIISQYLSTQPAKKENKGKGNKKGFEKKEKQKKGRNLLHQQKSKPKGIDGMKSPVNKQKKQFFLKSEKPTFNLRRHKD